MIIGGAQENTVFNVDDQHHLFHDDVCLITGPGLGPEGTLERFARDRGLDLRVLPELQRSLNPLQDLRAYRAIKRELRSWRPDIVHTHSSKAGILGRLAAHRLRLPAVHTIHGAAFHYGQRWPFHTAYRLAERLAAGWCDHIISVCNAMTQQYLAAGIGRPNQYTTIYSGMDVDGFLHPPRTREEVRASLNLGDQDIVIGKVARLFHLKGHHFLIEAAPKIVQAVPEVRFLLVGDGILRDRFEARIHQLGLRDHFRFTGLVPPDQVSSFVHAMDIVAHTSE
ncbi:MAG: glycosyltransferase, partial [Planctomycetaceae bacterium]|nr:glycosyltransferase [Planctomycetaceae bacterium]